MRNAGDQIFLSTDRWIFTIAYLKKQSLGVFCEKRCSYKFRKFYKETSVLESVFNKVVGLRNCNLFTLKHGPACLFYVFKLSCHYLDLVSFYVSFKYQIKYQNFLVPTKREARIVGLKTIRTFIIFKSDYIHQQYLSYLLHGYMHFLTK